MDEDEKVAIDHVVTIISEALRRRKEESIELERKTRNFWKKIKKRLPEEVGNALEEDATSEANRAAFTKGMEELMESQSIKMNVVSFLYNQGIELF